MNVKFVTILSIVCAVACNVSYAEGYAAARKNAKWKVSSKPDMGMCSLSYNTYSKENLRIMFFGDEIVKRFNTKGPYVRELTSKLLHMNIGNGWVTGRNKSKSDSDDIYITYLNKNKKKIRERENNFFLTPNDADEIINKIKTMSGTNKLVFPILAQEHRFDIQVYKNNFHKKYVQFDQCMKKVKAK